MFVCVRVCTCVHVCCVCVHVCCVCVLYRSQDATEEMEALVKAQNNPDEIELGEEGEEEEAMVEGEIKGGNRRGCR